MRRTGFVQCAVLLAALLLLFVGCTKNVPFHHVDYGDKKDAFIDAKDYYEEGELVRLKTYIVMDATPIVTADGKRLSPKLEGYEYLVYTFIMPAHDVTVTYVLGDSDMMMQTVEILYEGDTERLVDPAGAAYPGETVTLTLTRISDVSTEVLVNGDPARRIGGAEEGYLSFEFTVPYGEPTVTVTIRSANVSDPA